MGRFIVGTTVFGLALYRFESYFLVRKGSFKRGKLEFPETE